MNRQTSGKFTLLFILFLNVVFLHAQVTVNLSGTIKDNTGKPVAGATVSLKVITNLKTTTATDGSYKLQQNVSIVNNNIIDLNAGIVIRDNMVIVNQKTSGSADISMYDMKGSKISSLFNGQLPAGSHVFSIPKNCAVSMHILGITQNNIVQYIKTGLNTNTIPTTSLSQIDQIASRSYYAIDSLIVTQTGFATQRKGIDSYTGQQNFSLAPIRYPKVSGSCSPCGRLAQCVTVCPNKAVSKVGGKAVWDKNKCQGVDSPCKGKCTTTVHFLRKPTFIEKIESLFSE